jgi:heat shock protein HtpX
MPYSFTQIEKERSRTISWAFLFLIFMYFVSTWVIVFIVKNIIYLQNRENILDQFGFVPLNAPSSFFILVIAFVIGFFHFQYTTSNLIPKISTILEAEPLDLNDRYHKMFQNILDEVSIATGGTKIEGFVIPTAALNAFAITDFDGRNIIGVTEGLLYRLNRAQIEAVVGHEAAHIVSGDCLSTTVTTSIYALYSGIMKGIESVLGGRRRYSSREGSGGQLIVIVMVVYILIALMRFLSFWGGMFISRQREYRADAIAARLTRDPLSLAEALYKIAYKWRGAGLAADELEAIFILNPQYKFKDEQEDFFSNLFSTHPPVANRLKILLDMGNLDEKALAERVDQEIERPKETVPTVTTSPQPQCWFIFNEGIWNGPMTLTALNAFPQMSAESLIKSTYSSEVKMAYQMDEIKTAKADSQTNHPILCPKCQIAMNTVDYEGREVFKCNLCQGTFLHEGDIRRLIIRRDVEFTEPIKKWAEALQDNMNKANIQDVKRDPKTLLNCPKCSVGKVPIVMNKLFYTMAYPVEVDRCFECGMYWFEKDELEVLQYMIEKNT